jgi:signal peptidase I
MVPDSCYDPRPSPAAPYADFMSRAFARIADTALLRSVSLAVTTLCALGVAMRLLPGVVLAVASWWLWWPLFICYFALYTMKSGQTPGKRFLGIQVQRPDGALPGAGRTWGRTLFDVAFTAVGYVLTPYTGVISLADVLLVAVRQDKRSGHDLLAGTVVRRVRPAPDGSLLVLSVLAVMVLIGLAQMVTVSSHEATLAMAPTVNKGETWVANRLAYRFRAPAVGDLVVFRASTMGPLPGHAQHTDWYARRVVALAGDTVAIHDGSLWRNGVAATGPATQGLGNVVWPYDGAADKVVPPGQVMVLADSRMDPRSDVFTVRPKLGEPEAGPFVPAASIKGQAVAIELPFWRMCSLN